jgi:hypothetical protein
MARILDFVSPQSDASIQEANAARLRALDPQRVFVYEVDTPARVSCDTDFLHGKGVCYLMHSDGQEVDILCLACAVTEVEGWLLVDPDRQVVVAVAR